MAAQKEAGSVESESGWAATDIHHGLTSGRCQGHLTVPRTWHLFIHRGSRLGTPSIPGWQHLQLASIEP